MLYSSCCFDYKSFWLARIFGFALRTKAVQSFSSSTTTSMSTSFWKVPFVHPMLWARRQSETQKYSTPVKKSTTPVIRRHVKWDWINWEIPSAKTATPAIKRQIDKTRRAIHQHDGSYSEFPQQHNDVVWFLAEFIFSIFSVLSLQ